MVPTLMMWATFLKFSIYYIDRGIKVYAGLKYPTTNIVGTFCLSNFDLSGFCCIKLR